MAVFMLDKDKRREVFFEEGFLLADIEPNVVFEISFLITSNADIDFKA